MRRQKETLTEKTRPTSLKMVSVLKNVGFTWLYVLDGGIEDPEGRIVKIKDSDIVSEEESSNNHYYYYYYCYYYFRMLIWLIVVWGVCRTVLEDFFKLKYVSINYSLYRGCGRGCGLEIKIIYGWALKIIFYHEEPQILWLLILFLV